MWKHYAAGILTSSISCNWIITIVTENTQRHWWESLLFFAMIALPSGFLAGFIGHKLEKKSEEKEKSKNPYLNPPTGFVEGFFGHYIWVTVSLSFLFTIGFVFLWLVILIIAGRSL